MTRLAELRGVLAGSAANGATVRWDRRTFDVHSVIETARDRRAAYVAENLASGLKHLSAWLGLTGLVTSFRRYVHRRRTLQQLSALDDRMLSDIGVNRADIEATAALSGESPAAADSTLWHGLAAWASRELRRRRTLRELSAMSDELLADIGIERSEIPAIAAALAERSSKARSDSELAMAAVAAPSKEELVAEVLAFTQVRRSVRRAVNQNHSRSSAA
jgi:uncharacterized protein YjiS (DUF1127 family)